LVKQNYNSLPLCTSSSTKGLLSLITKLRYLEIPVEAKPESYRKSTLIIVKKIIKRH